MIVFCDSESFDDGPAWVCMYGCHMHIRASLWALLWEVLTEYQHDRHLVG